MDSIDIQQIHNNNFTNTQYGKFQRISCYPWQYGSSGSFLVRFWSYFFGSIYFKRFIFNFSCWKPNWYQYWCTTIPRPVRTTWQLGRHQQLESNSEPRAHYRRTVTDRPLPLYQNFLQKSLFPLCKLWSYWPFDLHGWFQMVMCDHKSPMKRPWLAAMCLVCFSTVWVHWWTCSLHNLLY